MDRQIHKTFTKNVLLPLYLPDMIWNNGASLKGKGFHFSLNLLKKDLRSHYKKYKREGEIILIDFKQFFPSASHDVVLDRHKKLIFNNDLKIIGKKIIKANGVTKGLPLGVEPSQVEMIALPCPLDNFVKCQLSIKGFGHYMDDYYLIVPPDKNAKTILNLFIKKASSLGLTVNLNKTRIVKLTKPFKFCKAKFFLTETGRVVVNGSRDSMKRARKKIKSFKSKIEDKTMSYEDLWTAMNSMDAYFKNYNDHNRILKLRRLFYSLYGFSSENIENFRKRENKNEIYSL